MRALAIALGLLAGCAETNTIICGTVTCPADATCGPNNECVPADCGDGAVNGIETCDVALPVTDVCSDFGYSAGPPPTCSVVCQLDTSMCFDTCGNGSIDGLELCDGMPPAGYGCADFGFDVGPLVCSRSCSPAFELCGAIGWRALPGGATNELRAIWASGPTVGFAVGLEGTIVRAADGVWVPMVSGTTADLYGVTGTAEGAIAVGEGGSIRRFDPATQAWAAMTSPSAATLFAVTATGPQSAIAVGADGVILELANGSWTVARPATLSGPDLLAVWAGPALAFAVGEDGAVLRRVNNNWSEATIPMFSGRTLQSVFAADGEIFVGADNRTLFHYDGVSWAAVPLPTTIVSTASIVALAGSSASDVFITAEGGYIAHWDGSVVAAQTSPTSRTIFGLFEFGPDRVLGATRGGAIVEYTGTDRRVEHPNSTTAGNTRLEGIHRQGSTYYVVGGLGLVLRYSPSLGWSSQTVAGSPGLSSVWSDGTDTWVGAQTDVYLSDDSAAFQPASAGGGANDIWGVTSPAIRVVAVGDMVLEWNGSSWSVTQPNGSSNTLHGVWSTPEGTWFAVGDNGFAMRRVGNTGVWQPMTTHTTEDLQSVWGSAADDVFAVGQHGVILYWNGTTWRHVYTGSGQNLIAVHGTSHDDVYVTATSQALYHFDGTSWTRMTTEIDVDEVWAAGDKTLFVGALGSVQWLARTIGTTEDRCSDPWDNDGDGMANCNDPDCRTKPECALGGACATPLRVYCDTAGLEGTTFSGIARLDDLPCLDHSTPGPEASYRYVAETTGPVTVTIEDPQSMLDLSVVDAAFGACQVETCRAPTVSGPRRSVTFDAMVGRAYYFVVDGPLYRGGAFTLDVSCD